MSVNGRHNADSALIGALAAGLTYADAARAARVSERTARRRMNDEAFRSQVTRARADLVQLAVGKASDSLVEAVDTLLELMRGASRESVRLGAARALLDFVGRRRSDPITEAINGVTTVSGPQLGRLIDSVVDAALERMPNEAQGPFLRDVLALAS